MADDHEPTQQQDGAAKPSGDAPEAIAPYVDPQGRHVHPRHKRIALRKVRQLGLAARNGDEALRALAARDIDIIGLNDGEGQPPDAQGSAPAPAPATVPAALNAKPPVEEPNQNEAKGKNLPVPSKGDKVPEKQQDKKQQDRQRAKRLKEERDREIARIQRGLVSRRRRKLRRMLLRLAVFVFAPTWVVSYYYWSVATEMFETSSAFVIQTSESSSTTGGLGGLLAGTGFATSQDSVVVQDYLQSREAYGLLERDHNFTEHFQSPEIDRIQRLPVDATTDDAYNLYSKKVKIGYDPTEGVIRLSVVASDPQTSQMMSESLVRYAEERVDMLSREARGDRMEQAELRYREMEAKRIQAQLRVLELQQQRGVLSADIELQSQMAIIQQLEVQAVERDLALQEVLANPRPNATKVEVLQREIKLLNERIKERRGELTEATEGTISLARIGAELLAAETDLATRQLLEQESLAAMEASRLEAERQVRYLSLAVRPVAPVSATFPKKIESTAMAFVVFSAIYIMVSLTIAILREQVSV